MKARFLLPVCLLALLVNAFSIYNYLLAICTVFLLLLLFIPSVFIKLISAAEGQDKSKQNFAVRQIGSYGKQKTTRQLNRLSIAFSLIVVNLAAVGLSILTYVNLDRTARFIAQHISWREITPVLSAIGFILFAASVILVTIHAIKTLKNEKLFIA